MHKLCNGHNPSERAPIHSSIGQADMTTPEMPNEFLCPISQELMMFPLMTRSGQSYDKESIIEWISQHNHTCPLTRRPLKVSDLVPNNALRMRIQVWCNENNYVGKRQRKGNDSVLLTCLASTMDEHRNKDSRASQRKPLIFLRLNPN